MVSVKYRCEETEVYSREGAMWKGDPSKRGDTVSAMLQNQL